MDKTTDYEWYSDKWSYIWDQEEEKRINQDKVSFTRAIKLSSSKTQFAYKFWGDVYADLNDLPKKILKFKRFLTISPDIYKVAHQVRDSLEKLGNYEEALISSEDCIRMEPEALNAHHSFLRILKKLNRFEQMESRYEELLNRNPEIRSNSLFYFSKAEELVQLNEYSSAFESYRKAVEAPSEHESDFRFHYALALYHEAFYQEALNEFEKVLELEPNERVAYNNIAFMKYSLGNIQEAIDVLEEIIEKNMEIYLTYPNLILFKYQLSQNEDVKQPYIAKLKEITESDLSKLKKLYTDVLEQTEKKLSENLDEATKEFYIRKQNSIRFILSLIE